MGSKDAGGLTPGKDDNASHHILPAELYRFFSALAIDSADNWLCRYSGRCLNRRSMISAFNHAKDYNRRRGIVLLGL